METKPYHTRLNAKIQHITKPTSIVGALGKDARDAELIFRHIAALIAPTETLSCCYNKCLHRVQEGNAQQPCPQNILKHSNALTAVFPGKQKYFVPKQRAPFVTRKIRAPHVAQRKPRHQKCGYVHFETDQVRWVHRFPANAQLQRSS